MDMRFNMTEALQGSLSKGQDIVKSLKEILIGHHINSGVISAIGAVSEARIGFFNPDTKKYEERHFNEQMEVLSLLGNVSIKDQEIFPHLHILLSRRDYSVVGGHLYEGTIVYALEYQILKLSGNGFIRHFDADTGLFIWK